MSEVAPDPNGLRRFTCSGPLTLPERRIQCYVHMLEGCQALSGDDGRRPLERQDCYGPERSPTEYQVGPL